MKQDKFIRESGPYRVLSISQGGDGRVRLEVYPAFPEYGEDWSFSRARGDGGGPGLITVVALATHLEEFLNQPYTEEAVKRWREVIDQMLSLSERQIGVAIKPEPTGPRELIRFTPDRKVIIPGDLYEAAQAFWEIVKQIAPGGWTIEKNCGDRK